MKKNVDRILGRVLLLAGVFGLIAILLLSSFAVRSMRSEYQNLKNADLSQTFKGSIIYNDRVYAQLGFMTEIVSNEEDKEQQLEDFITSSLQSIDRRILSAGIVYTMMLSAVAAYPVYLKFGQSKKRHFLFAVLSAVLPFAVYAAFIAALRLALSVPLCFPHGSELLSIAVSLLAVTGGSCVLALLLNAVRHKKTAALLAIPVVFLLFLFGTTFEARLYSPPTVDSFDYLIQTDERLTDENFEGEVYYNEEKNVLFVEGEAFEPQQVENPDHIKGPGRVGAYLFELLNPYSGNALFLTQEIGEFEVSPLILILYALKALVLTSLPLWVGKKKEESD